MTKKRTISERIHSRLWTEVSGRLAMPTPPCLHSEETSTESISGGHPWIDVCAAFADGKINSDGYRRLAAVRNIVETLGAADGRHFAKLIKSWEPETLRHEKFRRVNSWGNPIEWPRILLGTPFPFSPTTLRYLAHALWMKRGGHLAEGETVVEIGVGFGGLVAINSWISDTKTYPVDLPDVVRAAEKMLVETGFSEGITKDPPSEKYCVISNYAFTELSESLQETYFTKYLRNSSRGVIVSNAAAFAKQIGGRQDADLISWFRREGLDARLIKDDPILGPSDLLHDDSVIAWG